MKPYRHEMKDRLALGAIAVLGTVLTAGCGSVGTGSQAQGRNDVAGGQVSVKSPDSTIELTVHGNGALTYSVSVDGKALLVDSRLGLKFKDGVTLGANVRLAKVERNQSDTTWENRTGKRRTVHDRHNELRVFCVEQSGRPFEIVVRAFDDGIGFRYELPKALSAATQDFRRITRVTRARTRIPASRATRLATSVPRNRNICPCAWGTCRPTR